MAWVVAALALAGCSAAVGGGGAVMLVVVLGASLYACVADPQPTPEPDPDGGMTDAQVREAGASDATVDARVRPDMGEGTWDVCCDNGTVSTCFCPAGTACNYGWFQDCGDGVCAYDQCDDAAVPDAEVVDAAVPDAEPLDAGQADAADMGGTWEPCCQGGIVESCYCPAGAECNYGWFEDCGEGTCTGPGQMCP